MDLIIRNQIAYWGPYSEPCTQGAHGLTQAKREGDKKTPIGVFAFRKVYYRTDRIELPPTQLPASIITPNCGWCDDPNSPFYNQYITKPFSPSHEDLWMEKGLYDILIAIGHNDSPAKPFEGSAIFIHIAHPEFKPTLGCIGLKMPFMLQLISTAKADSKLIVEDPLLWNSAPSVI